MAPSDVQLLRECYQLMVTARRVDEEAVRLQRQGAIVAFPPMAGQEAAQVASVLALRSTDQIFPSYREHGAAIARGVDVVGYLLAYRGAWNGGMYDCRRHRFAPIASSVGSHLLHAVGWAMGARLDGRDDVAIAYFGEGATSEGDASEAFNFAGVFRAPVVFLCQNNRWAISVPAERQTAGEIWRRAEGFGIAGERIDGNDAVAVLSAVRSAAERARRGDGPTLIEAMTYRLGAHSTADDDARYRSTAEVTRWRTEDDPLVRLRALLLDRGDADEAFFAAAEQRAAGVVASLRAGLAAAADPSSGEMFAHVYAVSPAALERQRAEMESLEELERADA
ncbi:MAG TPA: thiamine pyrophosphate-dependent enzyme [Candidatus Dormibacteraeota bacterium]|nr:thiamine pyrophosphate-dependent enzyme [Candidatus Dormibacteraeota bacterium]